MRRNYKYYDNCMSNADYHRGEEGISVMGKIKLQNLIKFFNSQKTTKKGVDIREIKGKWNGYTFPILDKVITRVEFLRLKNSKKCQKHKNYSEIKRIFKTQEDIILEEYEEYLDKKFPNRPIDMDDHIVSHYRENGRRISREFLNRLPSLINAYARHMHTDYDNGPKGPGYRPGTQHIQNQWR